MRTPGGMELHAPSHWQAVDFISDLHLQLSEPETFAAWQNYMDQTAADAVFILGDLFEVWVGDDALERPESFEQRCADTLRASAQKRAVLLQHGNRDFLMGRKLAQYCSATLIPDPTILTTVQGRWLLSHGDELCVDDQDYQVFRRQVRSASWQDNFLAQPLQRRLDIARQLRQESENRKRQELDYADVDTRMALDWLKQHQTRHLIHGHTHKPGFHQLDASHDRTVLSDWDVIATPKRAEILRMQCGPHMPSDQPLIRIPLGTPAISQR